MSDIPYAGGPLGFQFQQWVKEAGGPEAWGWPSHDLPAEDYRAALASNLRRRIEVLHAALATMGAEGYISFASLAYYAQTATGIKNPAQADRLQRARAAVETAANILFEELAPELAREVAYALPAPDENRL